jgi:hypothetical protein
MQDPTHQQYYLKKNIFILRNKVHLYKTIIDELE